MVESITDTIWDAGYCDNCIKELAPEECPVCGLASDTGHACSHDCATTNLFLRSCHA
jgi:hypothetical protein